MLLMRSSLVFVLAERFLADTEWDEPNRLLVVGRIKLPHIEVWGTPTTDEPHREAGMRTGQVSSDRKATHAVIENKVVDYK